MRCCGRQCRGHGHVLVKLVRHTEQKLLKLGEPITTLGQQAQQLLDRTTTLSEAQRARFTETFHAALRSHAHVRKQSQWLTQGQRLRHCKIVNAYDPPIAPIMKGKSNCPTQFGRKPGILSAPTAGFIFAARVPDGNPSDPSSVLPLLDKVQAAIERVKAPRTLQVHSVAGDLGVNDSVLRQALHDRGILTVGIPKTVNPIPRAPSPEEILTILNEAGLNRRRTPHQIHLACASGHSRPVVESHMASLLTRGAGQMRYQGPHGAVVQLGMAVMAHNGAALVRIRQQHLSKRAQRFRRLLRLRRHNVNQINDSKN